MATKPILLTVDDDPKVVRAVERDVRRHFGGQFRLLHADSGATALLDWPLRSASLKSAPLAREMGYL